MEPKETVILLADDEAVVRNLVGTISQSVDPTAANPKQRTEAHLSPSMRLIACEISRGIACARLS